MTPEDRDDQEWARADHAAEMRDVAADEARAEWEDDEDGGCFEDEAMLAREEQRQHDRDLERDTLDRVNDGGVP